LQIAKMIFDYCKFRSCCPTIPVMLTHLGSGQ
jgi:hypothetical protein